MQEVRERLEAFVAPFRKGRAARGNQSALRQTIIKIIRAVLHRRHDLVMMTAEGGGAVEKLFGSTACT